MEQRKLRFLWDKYKVIQTVVQGGINGMILQDQEIDTNTFMSAPRTYGGFALIKEDELLSQRPKFRKFEKVTEDKFKVET